MNINGTFTYYVKKDGHVILDKDGGVTYKNDVNITDDNLEYAKVNISSPDIFEKDLKKWK